jgi:glycosyltransferase involved in cell wall biosynthesis
MAPMVQVQPLRVAIDAHVAGKRLTGNETYVVNLVDALARRHDVDPIVYVDGISEWPGDAAVKALMRPLRLSMPQLRIPVELPYRLRKDRAQLLHVQYVAPPVCPVPVVAAIHDVSFEDVDGLFPAATRLRLRVSVRWTARRAARILVLSEFTKARIIHHYGLEPDRIIVAPAGVAPHWRPLDPEEVKVRLAGLSLPGRFVLVVGNLHPRKNVPRLIRAVDIVRRRNASDLGLVIVGQNAWRADEVEREITRLDGRGWVQRTGYLDIGTLVALCNAATVVAYPSLYEGFGLPVVEGMACGAVIVASNTTSIPEVAGDAAILVDPTDDEAMADGLERATLDEAARSTIRDAGIARARGYTWDRCAEATVRAYREALARPAPSWRS